MVVQAIAFTDLVWPMKVIWRAGSIRVPVAHWGCQVSGAARCWRRVSAPARAASMARICRRMVGVAGTAVPTAMVQRPIAVIENMLGDERTAWILNLSN